MLAPKPTENSTPSTSYQYQRPESIKMWRADVSEALDDAGLSEMSKRWLSCSENCFSRVSPGPDTKIPGNAESVFVCTSNHKHDAEIFAQTCDLRVCPECARRHAARLVARYLPRMQELSHRHHKTYMFRSIMFSTPYSLEDEGIEDRYKEGFKWVERVMSKLMSVKCPDWKEHQAFLVTSEFGEEGRKLHYHVIHYGQYLQQSDLSREWSNATGGAACVVWVKGFPYQGKTIEETLREVLKYAVKFYSQDKATGEISAIPAQLVPVLAKVLQNTRRVRSYGLLYDFEEQDGTAHTCEACGAPMVRLPLDYFVIYCNTGFLPLEFRRAKHDALLHSKPADKSPPQSTASPPEVTESPHVEQPRMPGFEKARKKDEDWGKKR